MFFGEASFLSSKYDCSAEIAEIEFGNIKHCAASSLIR